MAPRYLQAFRVRMPARTVRLRLTLLYGSLFLASGAALLAVTYGLVDNRLSNLRVSSGPASGLKAGGTVRAPATAAGSLRAWQTTALHQLLVQSGIALAIMSVVAIALGWLMAGRTLRPLRVISAATRRISERNLHERLALTGSRDEVKDLADTIDGLLARLDAAFDSQRRFVANASHELRTPLMLTQTLLQVALADPAITLKTLSDACQEVLLTCKEQDRLIQALLTLARSQRGVDHRETIDLAEITRQVLHSRGPEAATRAVRVDAALAPAPVSGDPRLAEILVSNLIENAIRHNVPGGRIHVAASVRQARASFMVSNTGPHVPADQVERLLQPFQHLDGERDHYHEGLGLGLSIVAAISAAHEATLAVRPQPAGGLTIEVGFCTADSTAGSPIT
ncbi:MAG TPA: HAMP domain-containing sensor histidine kinase [Streptosporangiaceae bacterium]|nr:HAMP domain-containing sensor histidine kinase [Streptosporangiaceae bacterium]